MKLDKQDHRLLVLWAADCAERVLPSFEKRHPDDTRPRRAVEAGRSWVRGEITMSEARAAAFAAHAAARAVDDTEARAAARSAGHAAATAHVADHAVHSAAYAISAIPDINAAPAREREWQYQHLPKHLQPLVFPD